MITAENIAHYSSRPPKIVHSGVDQRRDIPYHAVTIEILKAAEERLQNREFVESTHALGLNPLWFLAETERNVYLWRNGHSLADIRDFEFWIDIPKLVAKRLKQLRSDSTDSPFLNPFWGISDPDPALIDAESDYLRELQTALLRIAPHLSALSAVGTIVAREMHSGRQPETVVIPA